MEFRFSLIFSLIIFNVLAAIDEMNSFEYLYCKMCHAAKQMDVEDMQKHI